MKKNHVFLYLAIVLLLASFSDVHAYTYYILGKWETRGCVTRIQGNTCVVKCELPGPPEEGAEPSLTNDTDIDYTTEVELPGGGVFLALPVSNTDPGLPSGSVILNVKYTKNGTPVPY